MLERVGEVSYRMGLESESWEKGEAIGKKITARAYRSQAQGPKSQLLALEHPEGSVSSFIQLYFKIVLEDIPPPEPPTA